MTPELLQRIAVGAGIAVGAWVLGWALARILLPHIAHLLSRTSTRIDDVILAALRPHVPLWFLLIGLVLGLRHVMGPWEFMGWAYKIATALFILSMTVAIASVLTGLLTVSAKTWGDASHSSSLVQNAIRIVVISLGLLVIAGNMGIAITPIITALGVGSLAVALALQPTLSNLFAGFQISLTRMVRIGDYVELETGQTGYVEDIDWRATHIRELPNNRYIVPNAKLADLIVRNYSLPENEQSVTVPVGVSYDSDLERVERVTIEVAKESMKEVQGAAAGFEPFIRYTQFGDSAIQFSVILRVQSFADRFPITHDFIKRLHGRYAKERIEIPFPQRVVTFVNPPGTAPDAGDAAPEGGSTEPAQRAR
jgi:small-conductance mechanosensitive channel